MSKKIRIKIKKPYIGYPGSTLQQNYAESLDHGYLLWNIQSRDSFDVKFRKLPNPLPYVTVKWEGDVDSTLAECLKHQHGSRFRIHSVEHLHQKDVASLIAKLRSNLSATEITFKTDEQFNRSTISAGSMTVVKEDLRSTDVLIKLLKEHYISDSSITSDDWDKTAAVLSGYMSDINSNDDIVRNTKWSLKHLKFDNTFSYGEGNSINFADLSGIVGIFGPNRSGKSSIVGTMMYSLFNTTDRGSIKNLHIVNARKPHCFSRAIINVDGTDYVIERQTTKHETKKGQLLASTALNVFKIDETGEAVDLVGEQRNDTEKVIRKLIGTSEDFLMTSLCAQGELDKFISHGSTRRRQVLSRFLDLDIFDKMFDLAKIDVNQYKATLKLLPSRDWDMISTQTLQSLKKCEVDIDEKNRLLQDVNERLNHARSMLSSHKDVTPVTPSEVQSQRSKVDKLNETIADLTAKIDALNLANKLSADKVSTWDNVLENNSIDDLKKRVEAYRALEISVTSLRHYNENESLLLRQQEKSLKILDAVPCGDKFPKCKFIKDAHENKLAIADQRISVSTSLEKLTKAESALDVLKNDDLVAKLEKIEKLKSASEKTKLELSAKKVELVQLESSLKSNESLLTSSKSRLVELEAALKNDENAEVVSLRAQIDDLQASVRAIDADRLSIATERGRLKTTFEKNVQERSQRDDITQQMHVHELIKNAFNRKAIPSSIVASQLPAINAEIAKILHGIVDFTVELEADDDSDSMEAFINYGDSKRVIELSSGMEKVISSLAIRVALINISSLPKTDMLIVDEGFGALDDLGVESCNRLLASLKRYFKTILIITHVDGVKDSADTIVEITKNEKDSKVVY